MLPTLYSIELLDGKTRLHVAEMSTLAALKIFAASDAVVITEFGAHNNDTYNGWVSKNDLPRDLYTVGEVVDLLTSNNNLRLVDFSGMVGQGNSLSTHDDSEASFTFLNITTAQEVLRNLISDDADSELFLTVLNNPGKYILLDNNKAKIFNTFDDYVDR